MQALVQIAQALLSGAVGTGAYMAGEHLLGALSGGQSLAKAYGLPGQTTRRRRRKMFTNTDIAQFAAAEAIGGKKAAVSLMMIRAAAA